MIALIKLLVLCFVVRDTLGHCDICVTEPLITSSVTCPVCNQHEMDELAEGSFNGQRSTSESGKHFFHRSPQNHISMHNNDYNWTTCFVRAEPCDVWSPYRRVDGSCNNFEHPTWGMSSTAYVRILPANYRDNRHSLALQRNGEPRPSARVLANELFADQNRPDNVTLVAMQWGQIVAHDTALSAAKNGSVDCCSPQNMEDEEKCAPIIVPEDDSFYSQFDVKCLSTGRTKITFTGECNRGPAEQINRNTHAIDASLVYGSNADTENSIREFEGGKLKTNTRNGRIFPPNLPDEQKRGECFLKTIQEACYMAGDVRINSNSELAVLQNLFIREHNRIAGELEKLHPEWDDETLYQESRAIVIAEYQHITYKDFLKLYIGKETMKKFKLLPKRRGYTKYNSRIKLMIINSFTTSAFRIPHSGIQGHLGMFNYSRVQVNQVNVGYWMNRPHLIQLNNNYDEFLLGLMNQPMQTFDECFAEQIRNEVFRGFNPYGTDLAALDIQRGRDHGLGPYVHYLQLCTGYKPRTFKDLKKYIPEKFIPKLEKYYNTIEDIELIVGSMLEHKVKNTRFGPTALCIIAEQFYRLKWGDRFWYEVGDQLHSFTEGQLREIRKASLSRLICDNSDNIDTIAENSFLPPSQKNKIVDCDSIREVDLNEWK